MKTLLVVVAHPDDESFSTGGTIAKYVKLGWNVNLVIATRGEAGSTGKFGDISSERLGIIRQSEAEKAADILGVANLMFLDYYDGKLKDEPAGEIEDKIFREFLKKVPEVIITFEPGGISNHPDHIRLTTATTFAFQKYAALLNSYFKSPVQPSGQAYPEFFTRLSEKEVNIEPKLYFVGIPQSTVTHLVRTKAIPALSFGRPWSNIPDKMITTVVDIGKFAKKKKQAIMVHETQNADVERFLQIPNNPLMKQEHFTLRMQGIHEVFVGKNERVASGLALEKKRFSM